MIDALTGITATITAGYVIHCAWRKITHWRRTQKLKAIDLPAFIRRSK